MGITYSDPDVDTDADIADIAALSPSNRQLLRFSTDGSRYNAVDPDEVSGRVNVQDFFLAAHSDYTTAIANAAAECYSTGKRLYFPASSSAYVTDCQNFASSINIILDPGATVQLKASATLDSTALYVFRLRASNSSIVGGTFDFNRDNQGRAAYNTAGGSAVRSYWGVVARGTSVSHIENVKIHTRVINCADFGVFLSAVDNIDVDVEVEDSGSGFGADNCTGGIIRRATLKSLDNDDWKIYPHAFDLTDCDSITAVNVTCLDQAGYDTATGTAPNNSLSDWFSGYTIISCTNMTIDNFYFAARSDTAMTKSVGGSIAGITKSVVSNITTEGYTSVNLELGACDNCEFVNIFGDGKYQTTSLWPSEAQQGCHLINGGFYADFASRIKRPVTNCTFTNMQMVRMLSKGLLVYLGVDCQWIGGKFNGNQYGIDIRSDNVNASFLAPEIQVSARLKFVGVEAKFNEVAGLWNGGSTDLECDDCDFSNNGQAANAVGDALRLSGTLAVATAGYYGNNSSTTVARTRPRLSNCIFQDDQSVTTALGSVDPGAPTIISVERPELYSYGQTITINNGATGPADLIAQVRDINNDELTISTAMTNFPLTAGTGTISTSGTTVTGSGTAFTTQITGRMWIKNGSNYRRVIAVTSNTAATLESAFPSNLSGASFDIVRTEVEQMRSQDYGIYTLSSTLDDGLTVVDPKWGAGNKLAQYSVAGSTYWGDVLSFATYAELQEYLPRNGQIVNVLGRTTAGRGGGRFRFTTTSSTTPVTNDPQQGIYVPPASDATGASGVWIRQLDNPRVVTPEMFGATGDGSTDDYTALQAAIDWLIVVQTGKYRGGTLQLTSRYATSDQLLIGDFNITIRGDGSERTSSGSSVNGSPCLIGTATTKPVIRITSSESKLIGFEVRASSARQAGTTQTGDNTACGIMIAPADSGGAALSRIHCEDVLVRDQVDDGFVVTGDCVAITFARCSTKDIDRHGFLIEQGDLIARTNKARPGIISMYDCRAIDSGGYNLAIGHPSAGANVPYRVFINNFESFRGGLTEAKLYAGYLSAHFLHAEQLTVTTSAFAGTAETSPMRSCLLVAGSGASFKDCRYISPDSTTSTHFVRVETIAGLTTRDISFEGGYAPIGTSALACFASVEAGCEQIAVDNVRGIDGDFTAYTDVDTLTIASGVVAAILENHLVDTEAAAAADDVDTINGGTHGQIVRFRSVSSARDPTFKNGTGNIVCGADRTLSNIADEIAFRYDATAAKWNMLYFADNA